MKLFGGFHLARRRIFDNSVLPVRAMQHVHHEHRAFYDRVEFQRDGNGWFWKVSFLNQVHTRSSEIAFQSLPVIAEGPISHEDHSNVITIIGNELLEIDVILLPEIVHVRLATQRRESLFNN